MAGERDRSSEVERFFAWLLPGFFASGFSVVFFAITAPDFNLFR
jgi:hypothetical protein